MTDVSCDSFSSSDESGQEEPRRSRNSARAVNKIGSNENQTPAMFGGITRSIKTRNKNIAWDSKFVPDTGATVDVITEETAKAKGLIILPVDEDEPDQAESCK